MFHRIQWRITFSFALLVIVIMTPFGIYLTNHVRATQLESLRSGLKNEAEIIADTILPSFSDVPNRADLVSYITGLGSKIDARITIIDAGGTVIVDTDEDASTMENHASRPEFKADRNAASEDVIGKKPGCRFGVCGGRNRCTGEGMRNQQRGGTAPTAQ